MITGFFGGRKIGLLLGVAPGTLRQRLDCYFFPEFASEQWGRRMDTGINVLVLLAVVSVPLVVAVNV